MPSLACISSGFIVKECHANLNRQALTLTLSQRAREQKLKAFGKQTTGSPVKRDSTSAILWYFKTLARRLLASGRRATTFILVERLQLPLNKRLFFMLGIIAGVLLAVIGYRKRMERLKTFEAQKAEEKARYAEYEREWKEKIAAMPFKERMEWELFEASLKAHNYNPPWDEEEEYDDEESY
jgi:hypothetical protein